MAYRVLARTYRPQKLSDVLGQKAVVETLKNAIEHDRMPHAFLLHGIRGVGKTTTARILAKGLNCERGITVDPCGVCASCAALNADKHLDVLEMDAASHTGVDDIREILESLQYKPIMGRFKVFIIDEVHMLSKSAFNALLKTLEEPPDHVKFILATTEIRKIPDTIISRCMRLDLKRFDRADLEEAIIRIAKLEEGQIDSDAAHILSRSADGSMRDALSLLDQAIHMGSKEEGGFHITLTHVSSMLGLTDQNRIYDLLSHICQGRAFETLELSQRCIRDGADPLLMAEDILEAVYFASIAQLQPSSVPPEVRELAKDTAASFWVRLWQLLLSGYEELRVSPHPSQAFEMLMLRACHVSPLPTLNTIAEQLGLPSKEQQKRAFESIVQPILKAYPTHVLVNQKEILDMNMASMMREAQKMQKKMAEVQSQIKAHVAEGVSAGGLVKVNISGSSRMISINIDPSLMSEDKTMMEDLVLTATNDAFQKIEAYKEDLMKGFPLPPGISF